MSDDNKNLSEVTPNNIIMAKLEKVPEYARKIFEEHRKAVEEHRKVVEEQIKALEESEMQDFFSWFKKDR